jgi:hypothetical protein
MAMPNGSFSLRPPKLLLPNFELPKNENLFEFKNRIKVIRSNPRTQSDTATRVKRTVDLTIFGIWNVCQSSALRNNSRLITRREVAGYQLLQI